MALDAVGFLVSALLLGRLRASEPDPPARHADHHRIRDLTAGWRYILAHRGLAGLFWNAMIFGGCLLALSPLLVVIMLRDLGFTAWQYGLITGLAGLAGVLGSLLAGPVTKRLGAHRVLLLAGIGRNSWLWLIPLAPASPTGLFMIAASQFLLVFFAGMFSPTYATYRMNATDDAHMARVAMAWSITNKVVQPVSIAAAGLLAAVTNARTAAAVLAAVLFTGIAFLPWRRNPDVR
jgi:predicted MFS family arabinose efflux permease